VKNFFRMILLFFILLMLLPQSAAAQTVDPSAGILVLDDNQDKYPLGNHLEIFRDSSGELTIKDVSSNAFRGQFFFSQVETPNFGYQDVPYWVRFRVQNQSESRTDWILVLGFRNMHYMDLYIPEDENQAYSVIQSGVLSARQGPNVSHKELSFNLEIPPGLEQTYYIRFQSKATMTLPLILMSAEAYSRYVMMDELFSGAFYGILLIMILYNIILYVLIKEKVYLHLALFSLSAFAFFIFFHATIFQILPKTPPELSTQIMPILFGFFILTLVMFVDSFLELRKTHPKIHLIAKILVVGSLITSMASQFLQYQVISTIQIFLIIAILPAILILTLFLACRGDRSAKLLLGSSPIFLIGAVLSGLVRLGAIASNTFSEELIRFGLVWMVAFWSLALADRINSLKMEAESSKSQIIENEKRLAQYMDFLPVGVLVFNSDARLRYINRQSQEILNQPSITEVSNQILPTTIDESCDPLEQLKAMQTIQQGNPGYIENIELDLGHQKIPIEVWFNPIIDETGKTNGTVVAIQNIQERLNQQEQLRQSEELRQKILEGSSIGTWMIDLVSGEVVWDSRTREIFGVSPDAPASLELGFDIIHPDDREGANEAFEKATSPISNGGYEEEKRIIRPDGQVRWISTRGNVVYEQTSGKSQAVRMVGIVLDITTQKQAEKELEESRVQYQNLVETMNEGLAIVNENMVLTYVNPRLPEMLGYAQADMIGKHVGNFFDQKNLNIVVDQFAKRRKGHEESYTIAFLRADGTDLHSLVTPAVVLDGNNRFLHSIAVISDISEQVKTHRLLDLRMRERTQEISSLMEVSQILVSPLNFQDQMKNILEKLRSVVNFDGASVLLRKENQLIAETFQKQLTQELTEKLVQPFIHSDLIDTSFWQNGALLFQDVSSQCEGVDNFYSLTESLIGSVPPEMVSWIGIPIKSRSDLIGVLSAHAAQVDFFKPEMVELMQAFANQIAIVFENNRLYRQARVLAAAGERNRLARELHDSVTQSLYSIRLYAEAVRSALTAGKFSAADKNLEQLTSIARDGMSDLRLLIFELKPPLLEELGLVGALRKRLEMVESRAGIKAEFNIVGEPELAQDIETQLYWVVYEALTNVLKHAKATNLSLSFEFSEERSMVRLHDDGVGFDLSKINISESSGLTNIIDRVENFGGKIQVDSKPGEGTTIRIVLEKID